ncbi:MAG TPA: DUF1905 domain-containing protein [Papillibacter sp.]|nr:DUF1905 domain-containing protein [Papillibacter sp.]
MGVVNFPYSTEAEYGLKGNIPDLITVDGHSFEHTLLPSKNGHYLVYSEFIRQAAGKDIGDTVHVTLEKDTNKRKYLVPPHIEKTLRDGGVFEEFMRQPDYLKREQVNYIEVAKREETKQNRLNRLIAQLDKGK